MIPFFTPIICAEQQANYEQQANDAQQEGVFPEAETLSDNPYSSWMNDNPVIKKFIGDPNSWMNIYEHPCVVGINENGYPYFSMNSKTYILGAGMLWVVDNETDKECDQFVFDIDNGEELYKGFDENRNEEIIIRYSEDGHFWAHMIEIPFKSYAGEPRMAKYLYYNNVLYQKFPSST